MGTTLVMHRISVNFSDKARPQPDTVHMVLDKVKTDGLLPTLKAGTAVPGLRYTLSRLQ